MVWAAAVVVAEVGASQAIGVLLARLRGRDLRLMIASPPQGNTSVTFKWHCGRPNRRLSCFLGCQRARTCYVLRAVFRLTDITLSTFHVDLKVSSNTRVNDFHYTGLLYKEYVTNGGRGCLPALLKTVYRYENV